MPIPTPDYISFENLARRWCCTIEEICQYAILKDIRVHAYIYKCKVVKMPKYNKGFSSKLIINGKEHDTICYKAESEELPSNGFEQIKKEDVAEAIHNPIGAMIHELVSDSPDFDKCLNPPKIIKIKDLYVHQHEILRFESPPEEPEKENVKARNSRWANMVRDEGRSVGKTAKKIFDDEKPEIQKGPKKGQTLSLKTITREIRRALKEALN